jgi:membrane protease subunit HflK
MDIKNIKQISLGIVLLLLTVFALTGVYRVDQGEEALVMTFGKITDYKGSGLHWRIPFIQSVKKESLTNIQTLEYGFRTSQVGDATHASKYQDVADEAIMITGDGNIVTVEVIYQMVISDVKSYLYQSSDPIGTLRLAFETVLRRNIQSKTIDDALLDKQEIAREVLSDLREVTRKYNLGVDVQGVEIQNIQVPKEVNAAYEDVNNAKNEKTRKLDEAEKYKNEKVPAARAAAYEMIQQAEAYKVETIAQATGEVANFEKVYEKYLASKDITRKRLFIETMESILSKVEKKYIIDSSDGVLKFLPIDQSQTVKEVR